MLGRLRQDVLGRQLAELAPPTRAGQVADFVTRSLRADSPLTFEVELLTPDGNTLIVEMTTRPLHEGGDAIQAVGRDITLRKQGEMVLQRAKEAAEAASARQERLRRQHQPRDPHADERHHRPLRAARSHDARRRAARATSTWCSRPADVAAARSSTTSSTSPRSRPAASSWRRIASICRRGSPTPSRSLQVAGARARA